MHLSSPDDDLGGFPDGVGVCGRQIGNHEAGEAVPVEVRGEIDHLGAYLISPGGIKAWTSESDPWGWPHRGLLGGEEYPLSSWETSARMRKSEGAGWRRKQGGAG